MQTTATVMLLVFRDTAKITVVHALVHLGTLVIVARIQLLVRLTTIAAVRLVQFQEMLRQAAPVRVMLVEAEPTVVKRSHLAR